MKQFTFMFLAVFGLQNMAVAGLPKLTCHRDQYENVILELGDTQSKGSLRDNFNGADLLCGGIASLVKKSNFEGQGLCVGIWDIAFDKTGKDVDTIAKIIIAKSADGKITAEYEKNADLRDSQIVETVVLECTLEN